MRRESGSGGPRGQGPAPGPARPGRTRSRDARAVAADVLARLLVDAGARASEVLATALVAMGRSAAHDDEHLGRDRALATELVYGVLRWRLQLESLLTPFLSRDLERLEPVARALLLIGAYQITRLTRIPAEIAVSATQDAARVLGADRVTGLLNAVLRKVVAARGDLMHGTTAFVASLPEWIVAELEQRYGARARDEALALKERAHVTLRPTLTRGGTGAAFEALERDGFETSPLEPPLAQVAACGGPPPPTGGSAIATRGMLAVAHGDVFTSRAFHEGMFVAQDPASLAVVDLIGLYAKKNATVLDLCAGRGVKTTALLDLGFQVTAVDVGAGKLAELERVARRLSLDGGLARVAAVDASEAGALEGLGLFDVVLVDAPCSGLGTLRRHPEIAWRTKPSDVDALVGLQARLLVSGAARVAPGGLLVFAVCTFVGREGRPALPLGFEEVWRLDVPPSSGLDAFQAIVLRRSP